MPTASPHLSENAIRLPQIPVIMHDVLERLRSDDVSMDELAELVGNDQVIAAKILRLANSSYYSRQRDVTTLKGAIQTVGLAAFRNLVIASSLTHAFPVVEGFDLPSFWRNSMLVANLAHYIGRELPHDRNELFLAGLMSHIGVLLIFLDHPEAAAQLNDDAMALEEARALEQQLIGTDHFTIGALLASAWNFPDSLQRAIAQYDDPPTGNLSAGVVHAAVKIARGIQRGATLGDMEASLDPTLVVSLGLDRAWFAEAGEVFDLLLEEAARLS